MLPVVAPPAFADDAAVRDALIRFTFVAPHGNHFLVLAARALLARR
jgi:hypothetical protein